MSDISRERQRRFDSRIRSVTAAGITLPAPFTELRHRLATFSQAGGTPIRDRIAAAIVEGDTDTDLPLLRAIAVAEALNGNQIRADLDDAIAAAVNDKLRGIYAAHARQNYDTIAAQFDKAATAFADAAAEVDPEAPAEVIVNADDEARIAWREAATHAAVMSRLLPSLAAAANLAGVGDDTNPDEHLPLVVDVTGHDRRALWSAWDSEERERIALAEQAAGSIFSATPVVPSRCGRWSALVKAGARLRACPLDDFTAYSRRDVEEFAPNTVTTLTRTPDRLLA